jgi:hypothetical protein
MCERSRVQSPAKPRLISVDICIDGKSSWLSWLERWSHIRMIQSKIGISKGREFEPHRGHLFVSLSLSLSLSLLFVLGDTILLDVRTCAYTPSRTWWQVVCYTRVVTAPRNT